jgi:hypothetical protein
MSLTPLFATPCVTLPAHCERAPTANWNAAGRDDTPPMTSDRLVVKTDTGRSNLFSCGLRWKFERRPVYLMRLLKRYHVHDAPSSIAHIHERALRHAVRARLHVQAHHGGLRPAPVKSEIGSNFATPSFDMELIQPMARGMMLPINSLYARLGSSVALSDDHFSLRIVLDTVLSPSAGERLSASPANREHVCRSVLRDRRLGLLNSRRSINPIWFAFRSFRTEMSLIAKRSFPVGRLRLSASRGRLRPPHCSARVKTMAVPPYQGNRNQE